jgi:hypothetical protein
MGVAVVGFPGLGAATQRVSGGATEENGGGICIPPLETDLPHVCPSYIFEFDNVFQFVLYLCLPFPWKNVPLPCPQSGESWRRLVFVQCNIAISAFIYIRCSSLSTELY